MGAKRQFSENHCALIRAKFVARKKAFVHFGFKIGDRVRVRSDHQFASDRGKSGIVTNIPFPRHLSAPWVYVQIDGQDFTTTWFHGHLELSEPALGQSRQPEK